MISSEADVRAYVREASGGCARWVEPGLGSTSGLPDCWVPYEGHCVHLELKCGSIRNGSLSYTIRPEQRRQIIEMRDHGIAVGLLVGVKFSHSMIFLLPTPENLHGKLSLSVHDLAADRIETDSRIATSFSAGVYFIFSNMSKWVSA